MTSLNTQHYQRIVDTLRRQYGDVLYSRNGQTHPISVYLPDDSQIDDVDSVLGRVSDQFTDKDSLAFYDYAYLHTLQNAGRNLFNGTTFSFKHLRTNPLKLHGELGKYFDMIATCGALQHEIQDSALQGRFRLPNRKQLHRQVTPEETLTTGKGRSATIGVATLVVFNDEGVYKAVLGQRSAQAATDPLFYHLIPAFIFQPSTDTLQFPEEWSVSHQVYREFLEELFALDEITPDRYDYFYEHPALLYLQELMAQKQASHHLTGVVLNLLTLRPEICTLLLIRDPEWFKRVSVPDSDMTLSTAAETNSDNVVYLPIETDEMTLGSLPANVHTMMPPQAIAGLWLGVDSARNLLKFG